MKRSTIRTVILLAIIALVSVVFAQYYWFQTAIEIQEHQAELQNEQTFLDDKSFNDRVTVALTKVAEKILSIQDDPADLYDAVSQLKSNYFTVSINDTLHPYLLESLLKREFTRRNIKENFEYGIYDCFTDSVVYGNFVALADSTDSAAVEAPLIRWDDDGHYFGVFFPNRSSHFINVPRTNYTMWALSSVIIFIVLVFMAYAIFVMVKQKRLSEVTTDFINNMTHELKTPISTIQLSAEVLLRPGMGDDPERLQQYASIIYNENTRLKNQVERVLQLAKLDTGKLDLKLSQFDFHEQIESSAENFRVTLEANNGVLETDLTSTNPVLNADKVHITNIVYNLLDNANKYSPENPRIVVTTRDHNNSLELCVSDNGIGMGKEQMKSIFDKFFRVSTGNVHDVKGFGLGLYYVKVIVEAHGGHVEVESNPGLGSTFKVYLPNQVVGTTLNKAT